MRNKIRLLILSAVATSVVAMPLVAAGCKTTDNSQDSTTTGEDSTGQSQSGDIVDPNKRAKGQLGQSQLSYIRDQFGFTFN